MNTPSQSAVRAAAAAIAEINGAAQIDDTLRRSVEAVIDAEMAPLLKALRQMTDLFGGSEDEARAEMCSACWDTPYIENHAIPAFRAARAAIAKASQILP